MSPDLPRRDGGTRSGAHVRARTWRRKLGDTLALVASGGLVGRSAALIGQAPIYSGCRVDPRR